MAQPKGYAAFILFPHLKMIPPILISPAILPFAREMPSSTALGFQFGRSSSIYSSTGVRLRSLLQNFLTSLSLKSMTRLRTITTIERRSIVRLRRIVKSTCENSTLLDR